MKNNKNVSQENISRVIKTKNHRKNSSKGHSKVISKPFKNSRSTGKIGEDIACVYLVRNGFEIIGRNYQRKWGELDIIAEKHGMLHFFEVKSVTFMPSQRFLDTHQPEENVHGLKVRNIRRMIQTFIFEQKRREDSEFQFHVLCVFMNIQTRRARVKWIKDVIL